MAEHGRQDSADWLRLLALVERVRAARRRGCPCPCEDNVLDDLDDLCRTSSDPLVAAIYAPIVRDGAAGPLTIGQTGQSLDARIATNTGHSRYINGHDALDHLHRLRALVDAVVVGATTVEVDDPRLTVRRVSGRHPTRVVIDPRGRVSRQRQIFNNDAPTVVLSGGNGENRYLKSAFILDRLHALHLRIVLIEGGAHTLSVFIREGSLDRLHVSVAPLILGSGRPSVCLPPIAYVHEGIRVHMSAHPLGSDILLSCEFPERQVDQSASTS